MSNDKKLISLKQAGEISGYSPDYLGQLIRSGKLEGQQVFLNVAWMTTEDALRAYMQKDSKASPTTGGFVSDMLAKLSAPETLSGLLKGASWFALVVFVLFGLLVLYVFSVTVDHRIEQKYVEKLKHV